MSLSAQAGKDEKGSFYIGKVASISPDKNRVL